MRVDPQAAAHDWLQRHVRTEIAWSWITATLTAAAIPLVFFVTWMAVAWLLFCCSLPLRRVLLGVRTVSMVEFRLVGTMALGIVAGAMFLFAVAERRCRDLAASGDGLGWAGQVVFAAVRFVWFVEMWPHWSYAGRPGTGAARVDGAAGASVFLSLLFLAPGLLASLFAQAHRRRTLRAIDLADCAAVLGVCYSAGRRVSFEELGRRLPHVPIGATLNHLRHVDGVLFLEAPPPALALGARVRSALDTACAGFLTDELRGALAP